MTPLILRPALPPPLRNHNPHWRSIIRSLSDSLVVPSADIVRDVILAFDNNSLTTDAEVRYITLVLSPGLHTTIDAVVPDAREIVSHLTFKGGTGCLGTTPAACHIRL